MSSESDEYVFNNGYCARVKEARKARGWTAEQMATALGVPPDRYRKYENRSPLPAYLIERFSLIAGVDVHYLVTGKHHAMPATALPQAQKRSA